MSTPESEKKVGPQPLLRATGVTASERYLQTVCDLSFLRLWSYPGVYRNQGNEGGGDGKEVCDLLVVFENDVLVFSDKAGKITDSGNAAIDWSRWFRRTISKSADQLWGAERWIGQHPDRLYLDRACTVPFPIRLPPAELTTFHLIAVAHGATERCRAEYGGSGSFLLHPAIVGGAHHDQRLAESSVGEIRPFEIGDLNPSRTFVHVLDDASLDLVMRTLDTVADFVAYLRKKQIFLRSGGLHFAAGEEDLMAFYLKHLDNNGQHNFVLPPGVDTVGLEPGHYENFLSRPERVAQVEANEVSYTWDRLLEHFIGHTLAQTHRFTTSTTVADQAELYRFMAREPRTRRRMLSRALLGIMEAATPDERRARIVMPSFPGDPHYVFLAFPKPSDVSEEEYREVRQALLEKYCYAVKVKFPEALDIVGIATEPMSSRRRSEDLIYVDGRDWSDDQWSYAREWQKTLRIFEEAKKFGGIEQEYPTSTKNWQLSHVRPAEAKNRRNKPCYCGSGKKYKRCCLPGDETLSQPGQPSRFSF